MRLADENVNRKTYSSFNTYPDLHTPPLRLGNPHGDNHGSDQYSRADSGTMRDSMIGAYLFAARIIFAALISLWVAPNSSPNSRKVVTLKYVEPHEVFQGSYELSHNRPE